MKANEDYIQKIRDNEILVLLDEDNDFLIIYSDFHHQYIFTNLTYNDFLVYLEKAQLSNPNNYDELEIFFLDYEHTKWTIPTSNEEIQEILDIAEFKHKVLG